MGGSPVVSAITAGIFDFSGVMTTSPLDGVYDYERSLGLERGQLLSLIIGETDSDGDDPWHRLERGEIPGVEFFQHLKETAAAELGVEVSFSDMAQSFLKGYKARPRMIELVRSLRGHIRTGLLTNNVKEFGGYWRSMVPVDELFDEIIDSSEVGLRKPDPRVYELALTRLGSTPQEAFFVDDFEANVKAAEELGIAGIVFRDEDSVIAEIRRLAGI
jgi:putative hydrolase of the HAD superfamily